MPALCVGHRSACDRCKEIPLRAILAQILGAHVVMDSVNGSLQERKERFDRVGRDVEVAFPPRVFFLAVLHARMRREHWLGHEVDRGIVRDQVRARVDVLFEDRLDVS